MGFLDILPQAAPFGDRPNQEYPKMGGTPPQVPVPQGPKMPGQADAFPQSQGQSLYPTTLQQNMERIGITWDNFKQNAVKTADAMNLYEKDWDDQDVDWEIGFRRAAEVMDPDRSLVNRIIADINGTGGGEPKGGQPGQEGEQPSIQDTEKQNKEFATRQRMQELYGQLRDAPFMRTWWGIIAYVLLAATTKSPSFAARIMLYNPNREGTFSELQSLREQLKSDTRSVEQQKSKEGELRRWAATQLMNRVNRKDSEENRLHRMWLGSQKELSEAKIDDETKKNLEHELSNLGTEAYRAMAEGFDKMTGEWRRTPDGKIHPSYTKYVDTVNKWNDIRRVLVSRRGVVESVRSYAPGTGK